LYSSYWYMSFNNNSKQAYIRMLFICLVYNCYAKNQPAKYANENFHVNIVCRL